MEEHTWKQFLYLREKGDDLNIGQYFWVFVYFWPIISFLCPNLTCPRTLPKMCGQLFAKMDSGPEVCERFDITHYEPKEPVCTCTVGEFSLTSGVAFYFFFF